MSGIYCSCLLFVFLRTKVNVLGRYLYLDGSIESRNDNDVILRKRLLIIYFNLDQNN